LRYRDQAAVILFIYSDGEATVQDLVASDHFRATRIYEPGIAGPYRERFAQLDSYQTSYLWPDTEPGESKRGVRCEDLQRLTFTDEAFDLVVTSDIFEHIMDPWEAFAEVQRVLAPGGVHVCSIPVDRSQGSVTRTRVRVVNGELEHLEEPRYHGSPTDASGSLVVTDFGLDLVDLLAERGIQAQFVQGHLANVTLVCVK